MKYWIDLKYINQDPIQILPHSNGVKTLKDLITTTKKIWHLYKHLKIVPIDLFIQLIFFQNF